MKRHTILIFVAVSVFAASCNNKNAKDNTSKDSIAATPTVNGGDKKADKGKATISFEKQGYDFGKVVAGVKVKHEFKFTNKGTEPLIISSATAMCGCTVPSYSKEPIAPGKSGSIKVIFDSTGRSGVQNKTITITANTTPEVTEVYLNGEVLDQAPASAKNNN